MTFVILLSNANKLSLNLNVQILYVQMLLGLCRRKKKKKEYLNQLKLNGEVGLLAGLKGVLGIYSLTANTHQLNTTKLQF